MDEFYVSSLVRGKEELSEGPFAGINEAGKSPEWRQVSGETCRHLAGGRAGGECATADWTEERASRWAGDKPKTLPPFP